MKGFVIVVLMVLLLLVIGFIPTQQRSFINIQASAYDIVQKLDDSSSYRLWLTEVGKSPILFKPISADSLQLQFWHNGKRDNYDFKVMPSLQTGESILAVTGPSTIGSRVLSIIGIDNPQLQMLRALKSLMEDPVWRYGFEIRTVPVSDSIIITEKALGSKENADSIIDVLVKQLLPRIRKQGIQLKTGYCYTTAVSIPGGQTEFAVGFPVLQRGVTTDSLTFLSLPAKGKLVIGNGRLKDRVSLYRAMDNYLYDQGMKRVAQAMEKYPLQGDHIIRDPGQPLEIIQPVY